MEFIFKKKTGLNDCILLNAKLSRTEGILTIYMEGQNLTNTIYEDIPGLSQPGIILSAGMKLKL